MISISTRTYDLRGACYFRQSQLDNQKVNENYHIARRVSRTATLDGGVSVCDTGYAPGDRDITIRVPDATKTLADLLAYIAKTYTEIIVATAESVFLGVPATFFMDAEGAANLIINLVEDIGG